MKENPEVIWALLCERAFIDQAHNLNIQSEFSSATAKRYPFIPPLFYIVARFFSPAGKGIYRCGVVCYLPGASEILFNVPHFDFPSEDGNFLALLRIGGFTFPKPDVYTFQLTVNEVPVHKVELLLK